MKKFMVALMTTLFMSSSFSTDILKDDKFSWVEIISIPDAKLYIDSKNFYSSKNERIYVTMVVWNTDDVIIQSKNKKEIVGTSIHVIKAICDKNIAVYKRSDFFNKNDQHVAYDDEPSISEVQSGSLAWIHMKYACAYNSKKKV